MTVAVAQTDAMAIAQRMAMTCAERERRESLYFDADGKLIPLGGWHYGHGNEGTRADGSRWVGGKAKGMPGNAVYVVDHPFRPSLASCGDMVGEHLVSGEPVVYDETRWEDDPRILEQAGPSVTTDWALERLLERVAA